MDTFVLDADFIKNSLKTCRIGRQVLLYKSTSSTNDVAAEYAKGGRDNDGLVVFAEEQTAGRGRRQNKWTSQPGKSILCSILLYESGLVADMLTLACAVAAAEAIGRCGKNVAKIKWPNDIFLDGKKVAGILVEAKSVKGKNCFIIGIGINCLQKQDDFKGELKSVATSIVAQGRPDCDRNKIAVRLLTNLEKYLIAAVEQPKRVLEMYRSRSILLGSRVTIESGGERFTGNCIAIEPTEGILLQLERGTIRAFAPAVTTIVKLKCSK